MAEEGDRVSLCQLSRWFGIPRRTLYYRPTRQKPKVNQALAKKVKDLIDELPFAGYRTLAFLLGVNRNTIQRLNQLKGWQCRKRQIGFRPRAQAMPSVASKPNERWATDLTRVWCGQEDRWVTLSAVIDCHTRELLGWRLSRRGNAKCAEATLEDALVNPFGTLARTAQPLTQWPCVHVSPFYGGSPQLWHKPGVHHTTHAAAKWHDRAAFWNNEGAMYLAAQLQVIRGGAGNNRPVGNVVQHSTTTSSTEHENA